MIAIRPRSVTVQMFTSLAKEFVNQGVWGFSTIGNMTKEKTSELNAILAKVLK